MKSKRFLCLLLVLLMVFSLTPSETRAETTVYFTAVNDQLLPDLSDETMPFWSGGRLYIPSTVITGTDLGLFYSRSRDKSTAVVYRQGSALTFNFAAGTVADQNDRQYSGPAIVRSDVVFLPLDLLTQFFSLDYSYTRVTYGYLVRVKSDTVVLSDAKFIDAAAMSMEQRYNEYMKHALEQTPGLAIHQAEVVALEVEDGHVKGVVTQLHGEYTAKCVVLATGTNLGGKIFVGDAWYASGPDGMHAANALTNSLKAAGLPLRRFKTGTPARVHRRSIDFSKLECQPGDPDSELQPFSFLTDAPMHNKVECWIAYTNPETHKIILDNIQRSPLYGGMIEGVGPRYCPSIEDKVVRFSGKDRHPLFVEPCGENTEEMYLQGASSSLPEDVQNAFYHSIKGFEHLEIMRPAYAIEYDCVDPTSLEATLESKVVRGLYGAGQFNGTSGYEEAAAQGLLAGLNAARNALGKEQLVLPRHTSYLGTLVDDLVTKGVMDPYRMMTSRSEYRLTLRQDNADQRLTPIGREYGLVQEDRWAKYQHTQNILQAERRRLHETHLRTADLRAAMEAAGLAPAAEGGIAEELLRRPEISYPLVAGIIGWGEEITPMLAERLETEIKYAGYIARQDRMIREVARHEKTLIPEDFEYAALTGLTLEAREKLARIRPRNLGQAGRIPGVSPSDVAQLSIALAGKQQK